LRRDEIFTAVRIDRDDGSIVVKIRRINSFLQRTAAGRRDLLLQGGNEDVRGVAGNRPHEQEQEQYRQMHQSLCA
jgi:hypothetical protein